MFHISDTDITSAIKMLLFINSQYSSHVMTCDVAKRRNVCWMYMPPNRHYRHNWLIILHHRDSWFKINTKKVHFFIYKTVKVDWESKSTLSLSNFNKFVVFWISISKLSFVLACISNLFFHHPIRSQWANHIIGKNQVIYYFFFHLMSTWKYVIL